MKSLFNNSENTLHGTQPALPKNSVLAGGKYRFNISL